MRHVRRRFSAAHLEPTRGGRRAPSIARSVMPTLQNRDGDPLLLTVDHFGFATDDRAEVEARLAALPRVQAPEADDPDRSFVFLVAERNTVIGRAVVGNAEARNELGAPGRHAAQGDRRGVRRTRASPRASMPIRDRRACARPTPACRDCRSTRPKPRLPCAASRSVITRTGSISPSPRPAGGHGARRCERRSAAERSTCS